MRLAWDHEELDKLRSWLEDVVGAMDVMADYVGDQGTLKLASEAWERLLNCLDELDDEQTSPPDLLESLRGELDEARAALQTERAAGRAEMKRIAELEAELENWRRECAARGERVRDLRQTVAELHDSRRGAIAIELDHDNADISADEFSTLDEARAAVELQQEGDDPRKAIIVAIGADGALTWEPYT